MYEYRVLKDYHDNEHDFNLAKGDIVTDDDFHEPDIPARLVGRGIIEAADQDAEAERLSGDPEWMLDSHQENVTEVVEVDDE